MPKEDLEKVVKMKVKPIIDEAMQKFLGARVVEIETDISDRIAKNPLFEFEADTSISFKKAKDMFKRAYLTRLLQTHLCNISKVADVAAIDRRSIHRLIKCLKIDVEKIRGNLVSKEYAREEAVKGIIESTLGEYKQLINPGRLKKMYESAPDISKGIIKELPESPLPLKDAQDDFEKRFIIKAVKESGFSVPKAAKKIGLRYETLHRKMRQLGI